jgi:hypothetical protein
MTGQDGKGQQTSSFTRELGLTHDDFFRFLPPAISPHRFTVEENTVRIADGDRTVTIELGPQQHRSIASLRLPYLEARFTFHAFSAEERAAFMARFERYFQRGGG